MEEDSNMEWTPESARAALKSSCTILLLDTPEGMNVGVDYCMWNVGLKFMGVKLLAPGPHYVYWTTPDPYNEKIDDDASRAYGNESALPIATTSFHSQADDFTGFRIGFFCFLKPGEVLVRKWSPKEEVYQNLDDEGQEQRLIDGVKALDFDQNLGPFPLKFVALWKELSLFISAEVVSRLEPSRKLRFHKKDEYDQTVTQDEKDPDKTTGENSKLMAKRSVSFSDEPQVIGTAPCEEEEDLISRESETDGKRMDVDTECSPSSAPKVGGRERRDKLGDEALSSGSGTLPLPLKSCLKKTNSHSSCLLSQQKVPAVVEIDVPPQMPLRLPCTGGGMGQLFDQEVIGTSMRAGDQESEKKEKGGSDSALLRESNDDTANVDTYFFSEIPKLKFPIGSDPGSITQMSHDRTKVLKELIEINLEGDWRQLLGELQAAYILFLLGQNFDAFQQWKSLLVLLSQCEEAVSLFPQLYSDLLRVVNGHLAQAPEDLFCDVILKENFLATCLANLCEICYSVPTRGGTIFDQMDRRVDYLKRLIKEKFQMSVEDLGMLFCEDAPQIVDASEQFVQL